MKARKSATQTHPGRLSAAVFAAKVALLRLRRGVQDLSDGPRRLQQAPRAQDVPTVSESRTPLWSDGRLAERRYQLGKVHNLRRAVRALDGVVIPAGDVFSFWRQVGRASRVRGFVDGRMLQQGCMVPAIGGGLCQLSNALYDAALLAGCDIVERHAHSRRVPGSAAMSGRDATVAWNYVDLRFRPDRTLHVSAQVTRDELVVRFHRAGVGGTAAPDADQDGDDVDHGTVRSCGTCAETGCFRHEDAPIAPAGRQAFLVDEAWPEFRDHVMAVRLGDSGRDDSGQDDSGRGDCSLGMPFPGGLARRSDWPTAGFGRVMATPLAASMRSLAMRRAPQGAPRRRAEVDGAARIARGLAPLLTMDVTRLWVAQSYLPHLWRDGQLGGRRFSVLMTRPPMHMLQSLLDAAFAVHPDRATLADYRAMPELVAWEAAALAEAETIVTPHAEIAALFGARAIRLDWRRPVVPPVPCPVMPSRRIAFPGPTLARKGAHEVREAARALNLEVMLPGNELEGEDFWRSVRTVRPDPARGRFGWLHGVAAVVQPALVEEQPRRLLAALAAGVPVLATASCGLDGLGMVPIAPLDAPGLTDALRRVLRVQGGVDRPAQAAEPRTHSFHST